MKIVDTNILVYVVDENSQNHSSVLAWWHEALIGDEIIGLPWLAIVGFLRLATNKHVFRTPLPAATVLSEVDRWLSLPNVRIVRETSKHWKILQELLRQIGSLGNITNDAHLAALAISHDATLVSCDTDFARFARLRWENPLAK